MRDLDRAMETMDAPMKVIPEIDRKTKELNLTPEELAQMIDHTKLSPYKGEGSMKNI